MAIIREAQRQRRRLRSSTSDLLLPLPRLTQTTTTTTAAKRNSRKSTRVQEHPQGQSLSLLLLVFLVSMMILPCTRSLMIPYTTASTTRLCLATTKPTTTTTTTRNQCSILHLAADSRQLRFLNTSPLDAAFYKTTTPSLTTTTTTNARANNHATTSSHLFLGVGQTLFSNPKKNTNNIPWKTMRSASAKSPSSSSSCTAAAGMIDLTSEESELFELLRQTIDHCQLDSTLRVAGGWVRDKLLARGEHSHATFSTTTSSVSSSGQKIKQQGSMGRQGVKVLLNDGNHRSKKKKGDTSDDSMLYQPVDIDIALDDMLGREFADHLNDYLKQNGRATHSVGMVLKNPEKSKHLETATMKVGSFWIDFVNLRAEEYTQESRIPDLMRIGTPSEDAFRRDLTINAMFYNINTNTVEDFTGRGLDDLRRGIVATPLAPLTTLLDDPLRVLRAVRFAARLRFTMDNALKRAAQDFKVRNALAQKVSRERVGGEVDLMFRSPDPVGAMRLLMNLNLVETVFPIEKVLPAQFPGGIFIFTNGLQLLSTTFDYINENKENPPIWCESKLFLTTHGFQEAPLIRDEEARRLLWYAAYLKPLYEYASLTDSSHHANDDNNKDNDHNKSSKKSNRSVVTKLLVHHLKRPSRDAEHVEKIIKAASDFTHLMETGFDLSAQSILLSGIQVSHSSAATAAGGGGSTDATSTITNTRRIDAPNEDSIEIDDEISPANSNPKNNNNKKTVATRLCCRMSGKLIDSETEDDPLWLHAMEFRLLTSKVLSRIGPLWRAALVLSLVEQIVLCTNGSDALDYTIEGDVYEESQESRRQGIIDRYDAFAAALQTLGLIGVWKQRPLLDGSEVKKMVLPNVPPGPIFREIMDEQVAWMTTHPCGGTQALIQHLKDVFPEFT